MKGSSTGSRFHLDPAVGVVVVVVVDVVVNLVVVDVVVFKGAAVADVVVKSALFFIPLTLLWVMLLLFL